MNEGIRTLFIDIETSPNEGSFWRPGWKISVSHKDIIKERAIICISYKWDDEDEVHNLHWNKRTLCDKALLKKISKVIKKADIVVGHNLNKFDMKWIKGRIMFHRLEPLGHVTSIDTLLVSRRNFNLNSHALDYLARYLGLKGKMSHPGKAMWDGCKDKDPEALQMMLDYCDQDVLLLEEVYNVLMIYDPVIHRGRMAHGDRESCKRCGKTDSLIRWGKYTTTSGIQHQKYKCKECGAHFKLPIPLADRK